MIKLRPYQLEAIENMRTSIKAGNKRIILQSPCGSGKTVIAAMMIKLAIAKHKKVVFLVHFRQLAYQAVERFAAFGMANDVGLIMAGEEPHYNRPVQVISVQTYIRRLQLESGVNYDWFQEADFLLYDEANASIAKTRRAILELYRDSAVIVGLTATPCRADGQPLGVVYQDIITCSNIKDLTSAGYLAPAVYYGAELTPDLKGIPIVAGDYNKKVLGERIDKPRLVGNILENWLNIAPDRQTVVFATNVKHSLHIQEQFRQNGITCEHVDAHTPTEERQNIIERSEKGDVQVITNVGVYSAGADFPWITCVVIAQPTKSLARYWQMAGRGLRPYKDKQDCIIIDHAGVVQRHGFLDEDVQWTLAGEGKAWKKTKKQDRAEKPPFVCTQCRFLFKGRTCPRCGLVVKGYSQRVAYVEGQLKEFVRGKAKKAGPTSADKERFLSMANYHRRAKGFKSGWTAWTYKKKFGVWPPKDRDYGTEKPDKAFKNYLTYLIIRNKMGKRGLTR